MYPNLYHHDIICQVSSRIIAFNPHKKEFEE